MTTGGTANLVPFNRPYLTGRELVNIEAALRSGHWVGGGPFTARCEALLAERGLPRSLLTTSCTDALELAALLLDIRPGDDVIVPSYTFASTANAFALRGATLRFADSTGDHPNVDPAHVRSLVTPRTRCIAVVHYAGVACDMDTLMLDAEAAGIPIVEDAAQAIQSYHRDRPLGTIGRFGALSFHATKNVAAGEGGAIVVNRAGDSARAEILREKGTDRSAFVRGEVDKYGWVDIGSSFLPSDLLAAVLLAQLEGLDEVQRLRLHAWERYHARCAVLEAAGHVCRPHIPAYATNNAHMYYLMCGDRTSRDRLLDHLSARGIRAAFHYTPLHNSAYQRDRGCPPVLPHAERFHDCLVRLPLFAGLTDAQVDRVCDAVCGFFGGWR